MEKHGGYQNQIIKKNMKIMIVVIDARNIKKEYTWGKNYKHK